MTPTTRRRSRGTPAVLALCVGAAAVGLGPCSGNDPAAPRTHAVEIREFGYHPESLTIALGDTVVWVNRDAVPHTATATDGSWDSGALEPGGSWSHAVQQATIGPYDCTFHPGMSGRIEVR